MLIKSIELQNITSHQQTKIFFQKGMNLLIGNNGSGKSSILNMIGYILFDFIPGTQKSYVRHSSKSKKAWGSVRIEVITDDETEYSIYRTIGKASNVIEVKDTISGFILDDVKTTGDLKNWLRDIMGVKPGYNMETIFKSAIGVPQGLITAPFLESAAGKRRKYFNEILHVDIYNKIYEESRKIKKIYNDQKSKLDVDIGKKETKIQEIPEKIKKQKEFSKNIKILTKAISKANTELKSVLKIVKASEEMEKKIDEIKHSKQLLEQKKNGLEKNLKVIERELDESVKAKEICDINYGKFTKYNSLSDNLPELEKKRDKLTEIKEEINELKMKIKEIDVKISQKKESVNKIKEEGKKIGGLKEKAKIYDSNEQKIEIVKEKISEIKNAEENLKGIKINLNKKLNDFKRSNALLQDLPDLERNKNKYENLDENSRDLEKEINTIESKIDQLKLDKERSKNGNCPILDEKCLNIGKKSLGSYFEVQIKQLRSELKPLKQRSKNITDEMKQLESVQSELDNLKIEQVKSDELEKQIQELEEQIKENEIPVQTKKDVQNQLSELKEQQGILKEDIKELDRIERDLKELPKLEQEITDLKQDKTPLVKENNKLKPIQAELSAVPKKITEIQKELKKCKNSHDLYLSNKGPLEKLDERKAQLQNLTEELNVLIENIENKEKETVILTSKFDLELYNEKKSRKDELNETIVANTTELGITKESLKDVSEELKKLELIRREYHKLKQQHNKILNLVDFIETIRNWYREAGPKITKALLKNINMQASELYRDLMDVKNTQLVWLDDFEIEIHLPGSITKYTNLSGGEQMAAALAVRLAILKIMTNISFAFFDEPTSNLDSEKRMNLSNCIQNIKGFEQLYLISHDDTFEENAENVIKFEKEEGSPSFVTQLTE